MDIYIEVELQHGYFLIRRITKGIKETQMTLVRMKIGMDGIYLYEAYGESKFKHRLLKEYDKQLKTKKDLIMKIEETIKDLTVEQLQSLLPSYYGLVIQRRITELNAAKTNRTTKKAITNTGRKRTVRKKSI